MSACNCRALRLQANAAPPPARARTSKRLLRREFASWFALKKVVMFPRCRTCRKGEAAALPTFLLYGYSISRVQSRVGITPPRTDIAQRLTPNQYGISR